MKGKKRIGEMLSELQCENFCTPNCFGCYGDGKIDITCSIVRDNFEKEFLKYYQPKIPEGSVVLSREEWERTDNYISNLRCLIDNLNDDLREAAKETAKEIFEKVLSYIGSNQKFCIVDNDNQTLIDCDKLWEFVGILAKQFDVEIKE